MKPRLIIVEGPDNCGKSTLARAIAARFDTVYWRLTSGPGLREHKAMELYQKNALDNASVNILELRHPVVFDRHWPSDFVYGRVLRGRPSCCARDMQNTCLELDAMYIYCTRDNAVEEHAKAKDPDHPYADDTYHKVVLGYEDWAKLMRREGEVVIDYKLDDYLGKPTEVLNDFIDNLTNVGYAM